MVGADTHAVPVPHATAAGPCPAADPAAGAAPSPCHAADPAAAEHNTNILGTAGPCHAAGPAAANITNMLGTAAAGPCHAADTDITNDDHAEDHAEEDKPDTDIMPHGGVVFGEPKFTADTEIIHADTLSAKEG
jgi:hypothetical protein